MKTHTNDFEQSLKLAYMESSNEFHLSMLQKQIISLNTSFLNKTVSLMRTDFKGNKKKDIISNIEKDINNLSFDFIEILMKNEIKFPIKEIYPNDELEALSMNYILSTNGIVLNFKPYLRYFSNLKNNEVDRNLSKTISDYNVYKDLVKSKNIELKTDSM